MNSVLLRGRKFLTGSAFVALTSAVVFGASSADAATTVSESFDLGTGTRFDTFVDNNVVRTDLAGTLTPADNPADGSLQPMGFGLQAFDYSAVQSNQFGVTSTQNAAGAGAGEFGGQFAWLNYGYGADSNLGVLSITDQLVIQARGIMIDPAVADDDFNNDETTTIGYFNTGPSADASDFQRGTIGAGIGFIGDGRFFLHVNGAFDIRGQVQFDSPFDIDLSLSESGGIATLSGTVTQNAVVQNVTFSRAVNGTETFDAFGIGQGYLRESQNPWRRSIAFFDDVGYSVDVDGGIDNPNPTRLGVPEPSSLVLLSLGALVLAIRQRRQVA